SDCESTWAFQRISSSVPAQHRTLMRPPVVKRPTLPRSGFFPFFPLGFRLVSFASGNAFGLHFRLLAHRRGCTKHLLRFSRRGDNECRDRSAGLCALETALHPRTVQCKGVAERVR